MTFREVDSWVRQHITPHLAAAPVVYPLVNWTQAGPIFPGGITCGDGLGSVNPSAAVNVTSNPANPGTCGISAVDQHWQLPYIQEWNLGIQHAFTSRMSLDLSYVGSHGTNLFGEVDLNEGHPRYD